MKDEQSYLQELSALWPTHTPSRRILSCSSKAVLEHPKSVALWIARGRLLDLNYNDWLMNHPGRRHYKKIVGVLGCYTIAALLDPKSALPHEELGFFYYTYSVDLQLPELAFRRALALKGFEDAHFGLAKVLVEQGNHDEAVDVLRKYSRTRRSKSACLRALERGDFQLFPATA